LLTPIYLSVPGGALYMSVYNPEPSVEFRGWVVHAPAFAEEMNKSRPMVNHQARNLAAQGFCVVVPDLFGTGDSSGEFGDASWQRWRQDLTSVIGWVVGQGGHDVCLWGLRLGCLLALDVARANVDQVSRLILWQPVVAGKGFMTQFLRLRMAANLGDSSAHSPTTLRAQAEQGASIEVAGYLLSPQLVREVDSVDAVAFLPPPQVDTCILELAREEGAPVTSGSRGLLDSWKAAGIHAKCQVARGEPFWATQEIAMAPDLLDATAQILRSIPDSIPVSAVTRGLPGREAHGDKGEQALTFDCHGDELVGVLHHGVEEASTAVLIVVGGPQYRVGSHRQFVSMSRQLAAAGVPVLRFDYRGMGDSAGSFAGFQGVGDDTLSAVDTLQRMLPGIQKVILLGLCDAATAAAFYAPADERIAGLVLINPWVRTERGQARTYLRHYYLARLLDRGWWKKVLGGDFKLVESLRSMQKNLRNAVQTPVRSDQSSLEQGAPRTEDDLIGRLYRALDGFCNPVLLILSGRDLTAAEFQDASNANVRFRSLLAEQRIEFYRLPEADHTFSREVWRDEVTQRILEWVKAL
jgi:exosortase A-associated hydrolase 1/exosortase A-associated hydrolase 2